MPNRFLDFKRFKKQIFKIKNKKKKLYNYLQVLIKVYLSLCFKSSWSIVWNNSSLNTSWCNNFKSD